jgi:hypothetical protein
MEELSDLEIFYFAFGMLRDSIWNISPLLKRQMLQE